MTKLARAPSSGEEAIAMRARLHSTRIALVWLAPLALFGGCASTPPNALPKYQPPPEGAPAAVIDVGKHGHAWLVDGAETASFATTIRLAPGEHRVGLNCLSFDAGIQPLPFGMNPKSAAQFVLVTGSFEPGKTYYARCVAANGQPRAWLADTPDGGDLPQGFTSVCTQECSQ